MGDSKAEKMVLDSAPIYLGFNIDTYTGMIMTFKNITKARIFLCLSKHSKPTKTVGTHRGFQGFFFLTINELNKICDHCYCIKNI